MAITHKTGAIVPFQGVFFAFLFKRFSRSTRENNNALFVAHQLLTVLTRGFHNAQFFRNHITPIGHFKMHAIG
jgi:hypothetical protein